MQRPHCVKSVRIQSFSGPHFPAFGLNTETYRVNLHIQSGYGKMRTRKHFSRSASVHLTSGKHCNTEQVVSIFMPAKVSFMTAKTTLNALLWLRNESYFPLNGIPLFIVFIFHVKKTHSYHSRQREFPYLFFVIFNIKIYFYISYY